MSTSDDVRALALALPETTEKEAWSMPTFRVAGKMFLTLPDEETSMAVRCPKEERDELALAEPEKFWVAEHEAALARGRVRLAAVEEPAALHPNVGGPRERGGPPRPPQ